jgi:catalase
MNDQIDSSIPVLTEIIAPTTPTTVESISVGSKPTQNATLPTTRPNAPEIKNTPSQTAKTNAAVPPQGMQTQNSAISAAVPVNQTRIVSVTKEDTSDNFDGIEMSADVFQQMEQTVRENVLRQVLARVDFVLEHRVRDSLAEVLQNAVDQLADDIRAGLRQSLEEVITRAVAQELTKLKSHKS